MADDVTIFAQTSFNITLYDAFIASFNSCSALIFNNSIRIAGYYDARKLGQYCGILPNILVRGDRHFRFEKHFSLWRFTIREVFQSLHNGQRLSSVWGYFFVLHDNVVKQLKGKTFEFYRAVLTFVCFVFKFFGKHCFCFKF